MALALHVHVLGACFGLLNFRRQMITALIFREIILDQFPMAKLSARVPSLKYPA
jgi:hypothetical protein